MTDEELDQAINVLCNKYKAVVQNIDCEAKNAADRAYGGAIRSEKGKLQEYISESLIKIAWSRISNDETRLHIDSKKIKIPMKKDYVHNIDDEEIKQYLIGNFDKHFYGISVDKHVYIDEKFVLGIECKSYTENAMLKRILVDFSLLKTKYPDITCYLFQLESQLGGDYSKLGPKSFGSHSTHTLQSYFSGVDLNIHTFVEGERKVDKPIHKHYKCICKEKLKDAVVQLSADLSKYIYK